MCPVRGWSAFDWKAVLFILLLTSSPRAETLSWHKFWRRKWSVGMYGRSNVPWPRSLGTYVTLMQVLQLTSNQLMSGELCGRACGVNGPYFLAGCIVVMICATWLIHTYVRTPTDGFQPMILLAQPAELACIPTRVKLSQDRSRQPYN